MEMICRETRLNVEDFSPGRGSIPGLCASAGYSRECSSMIAVSRLTTRSAGDTALEKRSKKY